jgi:tRNA pseudouridine38-40 synthase
MPRYFIEVAYKGTNYSGFQIQQNASTIQSEIEKALNIFFRSVNSNSVLLKNAPVMKLTGASRTDAGVHALQNFFHFDIEPEIYCSQVYNLNAILPHDIVIKKIFPVADNAHCRFDAISREYKYFIYCKKNPFLRDRAYYYPFKINREDLNAAADIIKNHQDFTSFSKKNTEVKNFFCSIEKSCWIFKDETIIYNVIGNRFLRGMVRGLVGTMLQVSTGKISLKTFSDIIECRNSANANFSVPPHGLFLIAIKYNEHSPV